jgi:hypothetical protein
MRGYDLTIPMLLMLAHSIRAAAPDETWFGAPGGDWMPDSATISDMKTTLDAKLKASLATRGGVTKPAVGYWFQFRGRGAGSDRLTSEEIDELG